MFEAKYKTEVSLTDCVCSVFVLYYIDPADGWGEVCSFIVILTGRQWWCNNVTVTLSVSCLPAWINQVCTGRTYCAKNIQRKIIKHPYFPIIKDNQYVKTKQNQLTSCQVVKHENQKLKIQSVKHWTIWMYDLSYCTVHMWLVWWCLVWMSALFPPTCHQMSPLLLNRQPQPQLD